LDNAGSKVSHQTAVLFLRRPFATLYGAFGELQWADRTFAHALGKVNRSCDKVSKKSTFLRRSFATFNGAFGELQWADRTFANALGKVNRSCDEVSKKSTFLRRPFPTLNGAFGELQWADRTFANAACQVNRCCYKVAKKSPFLVVRSCNSHEGKEKNEDKGDHCCAAASEGLEWSEKWEDHYPAVWWRPDGEFFMYVLFNKSTGMYEHRVNHGKFYDDTISQLFQLDQETDGAPAFLFRGDCDDIDGDNAMWQEFTDADEWVQSDVVVAPSKTYTGNPPLHEEQDGFTLVEQFIQSQKAMHDHKKRRKYDDWYF